MKDATKRSIVRWIHIVFAIPILGYVYSPFEKIPNYAPPTRFVFVPVMVLSGLWMLNAIRGRHGNRRKMASQNPFPAGSARWVSCCNSNLRSFIVRRI